MYGKQVRIGDVSRAAGLLAIWLVVGGLLQSAVAEMPPGWPPPGGGGGGGTPACNPGCTVELLDPVENQVVSGVVLIDAVLHITSGPPAECTTGVTGLSLTFRKNPSGWISDDWQTIGWVAGADVPIPRTFDSTEWCYLYPQVATAPPSPTRRTPPGPTSSTPTTDRAN